MKSVLSIRPSKIGTPICMHLLMTSRRCIPASRASSVGVKWIGIQRSSLRLLAAVLTFYRAGRTVPTFFPLFAKLEDPKGLLGDTFAGAHCPIHVSGPEIGGLRPGEVDPARRLAYRRAVAGHDVGSHRAGRTAPRERLACPVHLEIVVRAVGL